MKRILAVALSVIVLFIALAVPVAAAPNENASHIASCAVTMGGQHVAHCAQRMDRGVSTCAQMSGPCDHMP
jgi:hypothetical protein